MVLLIHVIVNNQFCFNANKPAMTMHCRFYAMEMLYCTYAERTLGTCLAGIPADKLHFPGTGNSALK
jgi:hypothetical protein